MSKKNERYHKLHGAEGHVGQHGKYSSDKNKLGVINKNSKSAKFNVEIKGVEGQEVTMKEKKPSLKNMPKRNLKTKPKQQQFPTLKKVTKKEKLANIKIRLLLLKYGCKWLQKTFGKISPSKAREYYNQKLLKRSVQQWEDVWWKGRNEWKLNIRADYHNRFRMWLKVWNGWRSFLILQKIKKTKINFAKQKADRILLKKSLASWKNYVGKRRRKKQSCLQAQEDGRIVVKRMVFSKWKNRLKFKQELHGMEEQALHFWAQNLCLKAWRCWLQKYLSSLEEKQKIIFAVQSYNRKLAFIVLHSFKLYGMQRKLKKRRLLAGVNFHRSQQLHFAFSKWKVTWNRKVELMQFEDTVHSKGNKARKQRILNHWKHYIILCRYERQNECKAWHHFQTNLKIKCLKVLQKRAENRRRTVMFNVTATKFYKITLTRRIWISWLRTCENRDDLRHISLINFVRNHYRKHLLTKALKSWKLYCERRKFKQDQKLKADVTSRRNVLPRFFTRWEVFVDLVKSQRTDEERAKEFRRECLSAKTFYRWLQGYRLTLDIQMLQRMAIISYDEKVKKDFFLTWLTKTRQRMRENCLLERSDDHYELQLKKKYIVTWRDYVKHLNYGSVQLNMAVRHQNRKLVFTCWKYWTKFVVKKREKWKLVIKADLHFRQGILRKIVGTWKLYCNNVKEIKSFAEKRKTCYDKKTLRFQFECWRENARCLKLTRQNFHTSSQHWEIKTTRSVFSAWRVYAEDRLWEKQQEFSSIVEARKRLDQSKLRHTLHQWKRAYVLKISFKEKWSRATEHWKRCVLIKAFLVLKKYRFLGYRKQVLRRHCMLYHNDRIIASHWKIWRFRYAQRVTLLKKSHMALWMWSFTLQRKAFVSWFHYTGEKRKKKLAINKALERRRQWLHKVTVTQWIKFATYFIGERERFAVSRHVQLSQNVQRSVQRCAVHWRRKTERNRGKRRQVASLDRPDSHIVSHEVISTENKRKSSKMLSPNLVQNAPITRRPQPRVPEYLRESFNLSELSEHISPPAAHNEGVPRNIPLNFQPVSQPECLPLPTGYASSITSRTSSNTSQTGPREVMPFKSCSRNRSQAFSKKAGSCKRHVLLPPSSFLQTKTPVNNGPENQSSKECEKKARETTGETQGSNKAGKFTSQEIQNGSQSVNIVGCTSDNSASKRAISSILTNKNSQQSIVQLRNRMLKYYTISTQLRDSRRKLSGLRQWSRDERKSDGKLDEEEMSLVKGLLNELSENVSATSQHLEQSYKTITNDLQELLDKVS